MNASIVDRYPVIQRDRPQLMLSPLAGPFYVKRVAGDEYQLGRDELIQAGTPSVEVGVVDMYAAVMGMAGVRAYFLDGAAMDSPSSRGKAPVGTIVQTGTDPIIAGSDRWHATAAAFNLIDRLTPYLFQQPSSAEDIGAQFVTGARTGPRGNVFMAINGSERSAKVTVGLAPYRTASGNLIRYRIVGATVSSARLTATDEDTVTFAPGETVIWLFAAPSTPEFVAASIRFATPMPDLAMAEGTLEVELDADGPAPPSRVDLFADGLQVGSSAKAPFTFRWQATGGGRWHALRAVAYAPTGTSAEARTIVYVAPSGLGN